MNPQLTPVEDSTLFEDPRPGLKRMEEKVIFGTATQGREERKTEEDKENSGKIHPWPCFALGGSFST